MCKTTTMQKVLWMLCLCAIPLMISASSIGRPTNRQCNGDATLCQLPFDRVTFAGTHNSAAYRLAPECPQTITHCDGATKSICQRTEHLCRDGWEEKCMESTQKCKSDLPESLSFLSMFCTTWEDVCTLSKNVCKGWELVCTKTVDVCARGLAWMCEAAPDWLKDCAWQNQAGHDITQQLKDGIRALDIDVCLDRHDQVVVCHGMGELRALGDRVDNVLAQIRNYTDTASDTVITIEFGDIDGDRRKVAVQLRDAIQAQLGPYLVEQVNDNTEWPTLGQLIDKQKRVAVFASDW
ncbi:PLC-like phosphodiesterase [Syncephalis plumigaleata]|nr:PLC-like phosphodiesterase [Syncephalis plumigaleata]